MNRLFLYCTNHQRMSSSFYSVELQRQIFSCGCIGRCTLIELCVESNGMAATTAVPVQEQPPLPPINHQKLFRDFVQLIWKWLGFQSWHYCLSLSDAVIHTHLCLCPSYLQGYGRRANLVSPRSTNSGVESNVKGQKGTDSAGNVKVRISYFC